jgi:hypothetical protein
MRCVSLVRVFMTRLFKKKDGSMAKKAKKAAKKKTKKSTKSKKK